MLTDYPNHTFTPEKPELAISFKTGMKLTISKFVSNNDLDFKTATSVGFQVQIGDKLYPVKLFSNFVTALQKDRHVVELNMPFETQKKCIAKIKIVDQK
jgi:hypothetical protein